MMNRQIKVKKLLVQLNALLLVAQLRFNPSKCEICLLGDRFSRCHHLQQHMLSAIKWAKHKNS